MSDLKRLEQEMIARRPWTAAEPESIWHITGHFPKNKGSFIDCLAFALPHYVTGGPVLFKMIGAMDELIDPEWITHGRELILVEVSDPTQAYYEADQKIIDQAKADGA
ncbi:hypothetical protein NNX28_16920 [Arthrobacter sp. zg-Y859]|uniref:Uncharacterized protein n=1 Tax=Arthrobacter jinronghuae TaxID=2964609 RepID=A0ABT1NVG4_9MICC|nr:hypothetical protein [Arthrobacter jinronghuae]MCQ1951602.1 hypothetical protein [Arthrobacter jinronghuae]UWX79683.1 hypothetical protein N2K98_05660 [Arthrobacter jinronghuae]